MAPPEQGAGAIAPRPDEAAVQAAVQRLPLGGGLADVTAYHDFHLFQIAFDHVWQQAIDAGVLDAGKLLCRPALGCLCTRIVGDEMALRDLQSNVVQVNATVEELKALHRNMELEPQAREAGLQSAIEARAGAISHNDREGLFGEAWDTIMGNSSTDPQAAQIIEDAAKDAYERAAQEEKDFRMRRDSKGLGAGRCGIWTGKVAQ